MFENTTQLTKEHLIYVTRLRCKTPVFLAYRIGLVVFAAFFVAFGLAAGPLFNKVIDFGAAILFVLMAVWLFPALLLARSLRAANFSDVSTYRLDEKGLTANVKGPGVSAQDFISYGRFDQLTVGPGGLYLRTARQKQYLVLDRNGFTKGTADEAARLIESAGIKTIWAFK